MNDAERAAWLSQRCGLLTGSRMQAAMDFLKSGKESAARLGYKIEVCAERMTGDSVRHFVSDAMQWGIDTEPHAKDAFEVATGRLLLPCGFVEHPSIPDFGATPDALIGRDGVAEFKCPTTTTHISWILAGGVPEQHRPQILAQLACTRRTHATFVSFDPRIAGPRRLFIVDWEPKREEIEAVEEAARKFLAEVDAMFEQLAATEPLAA